MYPPSVSFADFVNPLPMLSILLPSDSTRFTLSTAGVLGLFGGDEATFATAAVLVHEGRRWLGWYNTPGSYQIARKYGAAAMSTIFQELFPATSTHPANVFEPDGRHRPRFQAVHSGTTLDKTGHLASLLMNECASLANTSPDSTESGSDDITVSVVTLKCSPEQEVDLRFSSIQSFLAIIPITFSVIACIWSGLLGDWYSFTSILSGIISNGIFSIVIGSGTVRFTHHIPAAGSPPGDGILGAGKEFVLLRGEESAVNSITGGKLSLSFPGNSGKYVGLCSVLFTIQFILQFILVPQASLLGQLIFVSSLAVSWLYNSWFFACEKENIQRHILLEKVFRGKITLKMEPCPRRTNAAVFALCVFLGSHADDRSKHRTVGKNILDAYVPNKTPVWDTWKKNLLERLCANKELCFGQKDVDGWENPDDRKLLHSLYQYAEDAYKRSKEFSLD